MSKWVPITACILTAMLLMAGFLTLVGSYAHNHPDGPVAYLLYRKGIRYFEPSYTDRKEPSVLIADLKSYEPITNIVSQLKSKGFAGDLVALNKSDSPEHGSARLSIQLFTIYGQTGSLKLFFFNDRLVEAYFLPNETQLFLSALEKEQGLSFAVTNQIHLSENIVVQQGETRTRQDKKYRPFLRFYDERLSRERFAWEMRRNNDSSAD